MRKSGKQKATKEDPEKSMEEWGHNTAELLRLKCNQYGLIAVGKKTVLQKRIYKHFHPDEVLNVDVEVASIPEIEAISDEEVGNGFTNRSFIPAPNPMADQEVHFNRELLVEIKALHIEMGS